MSTVSSPIVTTEATAPAPFPMEGTTAGIQTSLFGQPAELGRASYRSNYAYLWQSEPATIGSNAWRVCVVEIADGHYAKCRDHVLEYRPSQHAAWKPQYEWPGYDCDKGGCGLPYQSNLHFKKHWGHIEELKASGRSWADGSAAEQRACSRAVPSAAVLQPPQRVAFAPGERHAITLPYSEVCIHMRVAGRTTEVELSANGREAQIYIDGRPYSTAVLPGEAGILESDGRRYGYLRHTPEAASREASADGERYVAGMGEKIPVSRLRPDATYLPMHAMQERFGELGYTIGRDHADCVARMMSGPCAGTSYEARTLSVHETDTGNSAFHVDSRRDAVFERMQVLRSEVYSLVGHRLVEV